MKKDRTCGGGPYPVYPPYPGMNMMNGIPPMNNMGMYSPVQFNPQNNSGISTNTIEQQLNNLEQQINLLDKRVTNLETLYNSNSTNINNKYNSSNYQMM